MRRLIAFAVCALLLCGCGEMVSKERAVDSMEAAGYSDVRVIAQHVMAPTFYGCAKGDAVAFEVSAMNVAKKSVTATVCCGLVFKACTIRH